MYNMFFRIPRVLHFYSKDGPKVQTPALEILVQGVEGLMRVSPRMKKLPEMAGLFCY